jgi:hypothetical protein
MVFCLYIRVKVAAEFVAEFKERWGKLAAHCRAHEPETLSYELCASDQSEDEFMIVEVRCSFVVHEPLSLPLSLRRSLSLWPFRSLSLSVQDLSV